MIVCFPEKKLQPIVQLLKKPLSLRKTKTMKWIIYGSLGLFVLASCNKRPFSAGALTTEDRSLNDSISGITTYGSFDVIVTQSTDYEIRVEAGEKLLPYISTHVKDNVLIIDEKANKYLNAKPMRVYVSAQHLNNIKLKGSGDVQCSNLLAGTAFVELDGSGDINIGYDSLSSITVDLEGSGDIKLVGQCDNANIELRGSGDIECRDLYTDDCYVNLEGSGDIRITVFNGLTVNLEGSGNIFYWGNPSSVNSNVNGSGNLVQM